MEFDEALRRAGSFGCYQKLLLALMVVPCGILCAFVYFCQYFIILVPSEFRCQLPVNSSQLEALNISLEAAREIFIPKDDQCHFREYSNVTAALSSAAIGAESGFGPFENSTCQQYDYEFKELYPTIATDLNFVCDRSDFIYIIQTLFNVASSLGAIIFGIVSDRLGRRSSIICSYCLAATAGLLCSMSNVNMVTLCLFRFLVGLCLLPLSEDPYVLALEYIGAEKRTLAVIFWAVSYISASMIVPWIAKACHNWRLLNVIVSIPLLLPVILSNYIPESSRWLLAKHRETEAVNELFSVGSWNGRQLPSDLEVENGEEDSYDGKAMTVLMLVETPRIRKHTILLAASWFLTYLIYHSIVFSTSFIGTDIYLAYTLGAAVELFALIFVTVTLDTIGRKWPMIISTTVTAVAGLCGLFFVNTGSTVTLSDVGHDEDGHAQTRLILLLLMRVAITTHYDIMLQYGAEVYPTILRGRGLAVLRFSGTLSLYFSPTLVYTARMNPIYPIIICGLLATVLVFITMFLPETMGKALPQTIEAAENLGRGEPLLGFVCNCLDGEGEFCTAEGVVTRQSSDNMSMDEDDKC